MKEMIVWLRSIESRASELYRSAAEMLYTDERFCSFLTQMTEDEAFHYHILGSAALCLDEIDQMPESSIILDADTKASIEDPMRNLSQIIMNDGLVTGQDIVDYIATAELSEWNTIFLYIIRLFQPRFRVFQYAAAAIQAHQEKVREFLCDLPRDFDIPNAIRVLPRIWEEKILVVDDDETIRELISNVLSDMGSIEMSSNGKDALDKTKNQFYNVIVSDIDMPIMNGLDFFRKGLEIDETLGKHIVFCSGNITPEIGKFLSVNNVAYIEKPFTLTKLRKVIRGIMKESFVTEPPSGSWPNNSMKTDRENSALS